MACLGVHFSLSADEVEQLRSIEDDADRVEHLHAVIEEVYFANHRARLAESDKAWDAMHRTLTDGELTFDGGEYPLNHVVLGGEQLYSGDDFIMALKTPEQVRDVARVLPGITETEFRERYSAVDPESYGYPKSDEDFEYTWSSFQDVREFWLHAASEGRFVLFTVDQ